jgi:hypothetical protein
MRPLVKVALVVGGYLCALLVASAVVAIHMAATNGPDWQGSSGMLAFGEALLFLVVFGVAAVPPSCAVLFFLRPVRSFWRVLSVVALGIATTGLAALIDYVASRTAGAGSVADAWSALAVLRILVAPLFALAFLLAGIFAPSRPFRIALLVATLIEGAVFACVGLIWLHDLRPP